jgi:hypothetical protein
MELQSYSLYHMNIKFSLSHKLRPFEKKIMWKIFGSREEETKVGWTEIHSQKRHDLLPPTINIHGENILKKYIYNGRDM